jgi:hypothetical protein
MRSTRNKIIGGDKRKTNKEEKERKNEGRNEGKERKRLKNKCSAIN